MDVVSIAISVGYVLLLCFLWLLGSGTYDLSLTAVQFGCLLGFVWSGLWMALASLIFWKEGLVDGSSRVMNLGFAGLSLFFFSYLSFVVLPRMNKVAEVLQQG